MNSFVKFFKDESGASAAEYALILAIVTTGIAGGWKPDKPGVDAITSASALDKREQIARSIVDKVLTLVNSRNPKL